MRYHVVLETTEANPPGESGSNAMGWDVFSLAVLAFRPCPGVVVVSAEAVAEQPGAPSAAAELRA